ncbi:MAG: response regulator transcription factor [Ignavibacteria bacterium]|nr:response regulator transcription factor [Ignavibacteria bacterium]
MLRVFIADDHLLIREGLKKILKSEPGIELAGESGNPLEIVPLVLQEDPDILILDLNFPGKNGLEILKELKSERPAIKVLILSMNPEDRFAKKTLQAGASGYISKESAAEELVKAIRKVAGGGKYISETLAEFLAQDLNTPPKNSIESLSDREMEVLIGMAKGKSQVEIADELFLSPNTINTYRSRLLEKLGLRTNADLIYFAIQNNLV